jgi:hypothetical protein
MWNVFNREDLSQYKYVGQSWRRYWKLNGGLSGVLRSPYFVCAIIVSLLCYPAWATENKDWGWYNICISIIPNLLGFTLGGYAMLLAFGSEKFRMLLAGSEDDKRPSAFMGVSATFIHFIILQILALLLSIIASAWCIKSGVFAFIGFTVFIYSLLSALAAALAILRLVSWFDYFAKSQKGDE